MRRLVVVLTVLLAGSGLLLAGASARSGALQLVPVAKFTAPVFATAAPGEPGNLYVVEQAGRIQVLQNGTIRPTPFLDVTSKVKSGGEQGLLSVAFDPAYAKTHRFYVDYTDTNGDTRIYQYRSNGTAAIPSSAKQLVFVKDFAPNHNGGQLRFGPDGRLYWGNGDGGGGGDPGHNGQNLGRPFAKIMRLNVNATKPRWQLYAYGLRNPWRFSFDRTTGDMWIGDVGQNAYEEVDLARQGEKGINWGWSEREGFHAFRGPAPQGARDPVVETTHTDGNCAIVGGYVYRGRAIPSLRGVYVFGDNCEPNLVGVVASPGQPAVQRRLGRTVPQLTTFGEDPVGEMYAATRDGAVFRITGG
jgi:glucose/arabinose dehydrogenase